MTNEAMSNKGELHSMILPVMVSHADSPDEQMMTYALLDTMSDTCFIKADLLQQLKVEGQRADLEITTLTSKSGKMIVDTEVVTGLRIRGINEQTTVALPKTYGKDDIPVSRSLIPKPESVKRWPHLQDVAQQLPAYREDLDVGLLIGANCSAAMLPKKVVTGSDQEPYAQKTAIGWGVIGWMWTPEDDSQDNRTHFVHTAATREVTPREVHQMFNLDFSENHSLEKMSVQDTTFLQTLEKGIHRRQDGHIQLPLPLKEVDESLPVEIRAKDIQDIDFSCDSLPIEHALGVQWCVESDSLKFRVIFTDKPATRRGLLSTLSSVFDPLGLISPVLLTGKKLIQDLCRENAEWDDPLPDRIRDKWERWKKVQYLANQFWTRWRKPRTVFILD